MTKKLDKIRSQIDAIDKELYQNLEQRAKLVENLAALKRKDESQRPESRAINAFRAFRPAREASLINKIVKNSKLEPEVLIYIWRQIISASLNKQQKQRFGLWCAENKPETLASAKAWAGAQSKIEIFNKPEDLWQALKRGKAMIGFVPCAARVAVWKKMPRDVFIVARWSYLKKDNTLPLYIIAKQEPEPSGQDCAVFLKNNKLLIKKDFIVTARAKKDETFLGCFAMPISK